MSSVFHRVAALLSVAALSGCSILPGSGFLADDLAVPAPAADQGNLSAIEVVDVTEELATRLAAQRTAHSFHELMSTAQSEAQKIGSGDVLEVSVWEAPPASLFSTSSIDPRLGPTTSRVTTLPEQVVSADGFINIPFAGQVKASGLSLQQIESDIVRRLKGKANQPQVLVRLIRNTSANVTVVGEVANSLRMPLTPRGERLLDALAAAGGVRQPITKMTLQLTRGPATHSMPLETIIRDPRQNVLLQPGDVVTALFQPLSFTALGATGGNAEINFEAQGITLAQALARVGGLQDFRADAKAVFIFRFEDKHAIPVLERVGTAGADGKVPVIYRVDLKKPSTFFAAQGFPMGNKDVLYVANASSYELQKFLGLLATIYYPVLGAANSVK